MMSTNSRKRKFELVNLSSSDFARMVRHLQILAFSITLNFTKHVKIALTISYHFERLKKNPTNACKSLDNNKKIATQS